MTVSPEGSCWSGGEVAWAHSVRSVDFAKVGLDVPSRDDVREERERQFVRNRAAIDLLTDWLAEGTDPEIEARLHTFMEEIDRDRSSDRRLFSDR